MVTCTSTASTAAGTEEFDVILRRLGTAVCIFLSLIAAAGGMALSCWFFAGVMAYFFDGARWAAEVGLIVGAVAFISIFVAMAWDA